MRYENKRVLVTGGAGFIGSNLVRALIREGAIVTVVDDLFTGELAHLDGLEYQFYEISVNNRTKIDDIVSKIDIIFHLAARNIIASTKYPFEDYETNIGGTLNILIAAKNHNVERVIYTSSASVYGNPKYLPINEDDGINLLTPYAVSKYSGEGYCMAFHESYKLPVAVLRLSNVYGTSQSINNPYCGVIARFINDSKVKRPIQIHGDGLSTRDFTFVDDVIEAILLAGENPVSNGEVFNVATGMETSVNELVDLIIKIFQRYPGDIESTHIDRRDIDNIRRRVLNIEKIRRKLGWSPVYTLENGIRRIKETL